MKSGDDIPIVSKETSIIDSLLIMSQKALGMVLITDNNNTLLGIFTDGDLRRVLEKHINFQDLAIKDVMTRNCKSIQPNKPAIIALQIMEEYSLNSLPVVDSDNQVIGAINMHTLMQAKVT
jgi:arabinose-5-phosphate isomerase